MTGPNGGGFVSAVFITFSGNCRAALTHYQTCFGGTLRFETFGQNLVGYVDRPVICGALVSAGITIHGSDLVHDEGRTLGNYVSIFLQCKDSSDRQALIEKLQADKKGIFAKHDGGQKLVEVTDAFDVRWVLGVSRCP